MSQSTSERLAQVLHAAGLRNLAAKARAGYYDDFRSPLATPIVQLVKDLKAAGRDDIAQRAMNGEFDATQEEAEAWRKSSEGEETIRKFTSGFHRE